MKEKNHPVFRLLKLIFYYCRKLAYLTLSVILLGGVPLLAIGDCPPGRTYWEMRIDGVEYSGCEWEDDGGGTNIVVEWANGIEILAEDPAGVQSDDEPVGEDDLLYAFDESPRPVHPPIPDDPLEICAIDESCDLVSISVEGDSALACEDDPATMAQCIAVGLDESARYTAIDSVTPIPRDNNRSETGGDPVVLSSLSANMSETPAPLGITVGRCKVRTHDSRKRRDEIQWDSCPRTGG